MGYGGSAANEPEQIITTHCRKACMPLWINKRTGDDGNFIGFEMKVQRAFEFFAVPVFLHIAMGHLSKTMHAGICAPGCGNIGQI